MSKLKSPLFWLPVTATAIASLIGQAAAANPSVDPLSGAPVAATAPSTQQQIPAPNPVQPTGSLPAPTGPQYLSMQAAMQIIPNLAISNVGNKAYLTGSIPSACSSNGILRITSTTSDPTLTAKDGSQGFAIQDLGGLSDCVKTAGGPGVCAQSGACSSLSSLVSPISAPATGKTQIHVAYMNPQGGDVLLGSWLASDIGNPVSIESSDLFAQDRLNQRNQYLVQEISACASSAGTLGTAEDELSQVIGLSPSDLEKLQNQISSGESKQDDAEVQKLADSINDDINNGSLKALSKEEDKIYAFLSGSSSSIQNTMRQQNAGDRMAGLIYQMAQALISSDSATPASLKQARAMLERAIGTGDSTGNSNDSITMSLANKQLIEQAISPAGALDKANLDLAYKNVQNIRDAGGKLNSGVYSSNSVVMTPYGLQRAPNPQYKNATDLYNKMWTTIYQNTQSWLKNKGCVDQYGNPSSSLSGTTQHAQDLSTACSQVESQLQSLASTKSTMDSMEIQSLPQQQSTLSIPGTNNAFGQFGTGLTLPGSLNNGGNLLNSGMITGNGAISSQGGLNSGLPVSSLGGFGNSFGIQGIGATSPMLLPQNSGYQMNMIPPQLVYSGAVNPGLVSPGANFGAYGYAAI